MKTFTVTAKFTVDLYSAKEAADWVEDLLESNFSMDGEEVHSVKAVGSATTTDQQELKNLVDNLSVGKMSSDDFAYAVKKLVEKVS